MATQFEDEEKQGEDIDEVICHWCQKYTDRATADLVGVDAGTGEDMWWCGCEERHE